MLHKNDDVSRLCHQVYHRSYKLNLTQKIMKENWFHTCNLGLWKLIKCTCKQLFCLNSKRKKIFLAKGCKKMIYCKGLKSIGAQEYQFWADAFLSGYQFTPWLQCSLIDSLLMPTKINIRLVQDLNQRPLDLLSNSLPLDQHTPQIKQEIFCKTLSTGFYII